MTMREQRLRVELTAVLSLGSNLGDRESTQRQAVADISALPQVDVLAASVLVETAAGKLDGIVTDAPAYLNAVVAVRTSLDPDELLSADASTSDRDPATAVISALAAQAGVWGVRVHDVESTRAALDVWTEWERGRAE